jgi:biopolymer transport protein ExbB
MLDFSETSIVNATLWLLACFSLITWSVILLKLGELGLNVFRNHRFAQDVGGASEVADKPSSLLDQSKSQFARINLAGQKILTQIPSQQPLGLDQYAAWHELIEKSLQQQIHKEKSKLESGLGWLASFGSTSPFVGLFGTVWGIMHALQDISSKGSASLEVVAGPIGEALIATAIGIAVAIPAVLAYNFFVRLNKGSLAKLDHFANDYLQAVIQQHLKQQMVCKHGVPNPN